MGQRSQAAVSHGGVELGVLDESVTVRPPAALAPLIAGYTGYRHAGLVPGSHHGLPSPYLTVIFTWGEPLVIAAHADRRQPPGSYQSLAGGLHSVPAVITYGSSMSGIQAYLRPLGSRVLLGVPAGVLASVDVPAADLLGAQAARISEQLADAVCWPDRFDVVNRVLLGRLRSVRNAGVAHPEVAWAWQQLLRTGGRVSVAELADGTGWSDRHLRTRFGTEIGLGPKAAGRVIRFHRARRLLAGRARSGSSLALAELAASCGYFDQAHLDRDFREMAGCSPTGWLAREFRFVQARPAGQLAG